MLLFLFFCLPVPCDLFPVILLFALLVMNIQSPLHCTSTIKRHCPVLTFSRMLWSILLCLLSVLLFLCLGWPNRSKVSGLTWHCFDHRRSCSYTITLFRKMQFLCPCLPVTCYLLLAFFLLVVCSYILRCHSVMH